MLSQSRVRKTRVRSSFEELVHEYYEPVLGFFARRGCSPDACQDLAQETFLRAYRAWSQFRSEAKPLTWLLTIATNVWRNQKRDAAAGKRAGNEVSLGSNAEIDLVADERPQESAIGGERRLLLRQAIDDLPPQMRRCVFLRIYQERSYRDIADLLGISPEAAKSQVSLAQAKLRSRLAKHYPDLQSDLFARGG